MKRRQERAKAFQQCKGMRASVNSAGLRTTNRLQTSPEPSSKNRVFHTRGAGLNACDKDAPTSTVAATQGGTTNSVNDSCDGATAPNKELSKRVRLPRCTQDMPGTKRRPWRSEPLILVFDV